MSEVLAPPAAPYPDDPYAEPLAPAPAMPEAPPRQYPMTPEEEAMLGRELAMYPPEDIEAIAREEGGFLPLALPGGMGTIVELPQSAEEAALYRRFMQYDAPTRAKLILLEKQLGEARAALDKPLFSGLPSELDQELLELLDKVEV